jgi:hypothetical protein
LFLEFVDRQRLDFDQPTVIRNVIAMPNYLVASPQAIHMMLDLNQWESQLQQVAAGVEELHILPTQNLRLRLLRDQYADKSKELLNTVRRWYQTTDAPQKRVAFQLMVQKYTLLNSIWLQIVSLAGSAPDPVDLASSR